MRRGRDSTIPVDEYIKYTSETYDFDLEGEAEIALGPEPSVDRYLGGARYTCAHCRTAFSSHRRSPICPFCHKFPFLAKQPGSPV